MILFCSIVVPMCDLVLDLETIHWSCQLPKNEHLHLLKTERFVFAAFINRRQCTVVFLADFKTIIIISSP